MFNLLAKISKGIKSTDITVSGSRQTINELYIEAPKNGYVYAYVSNESNNLVYFDNFQVSQTRGPVLEETHLYPFGSKMTAICSRALPGVQNSLSYQGKELDEEFDLDLFDFEARYYDPQTGRFIQSDPADQFASGYTGMGNNWVNGTDPDGRIFGFDDAIVAGVGAIINVVSNAGNLTWGNVWGYAATGAAAGWAGWNTTLVAGPIAGAAVVGAITGAGNALTGGASIGEAIGQGIIGGATGMLGGMLGGPIGGVISGKLSSVIGSTASGIVANITTSAAVGGAFGAGMSVMNGGTAWQGFVSGMRIGAITGAIASTVPIAINSMKKPAPAVPKEVEPESVTPEPTVKTEQSNPSGNRLPPATLDRGSSDGGEGTISRKVIVADRQMQAKFKHGKDFGVEGNYSKENAVKFGSAIIKHINSSDIKIIKGTYHKQPAIHYLNPNTGLNVIVKPNGQFWSGWKLSPSQLHNVLQHGGL